MTPPSSFPIEAAHAAEVAALRKALQSARDTLRAISISGGCGNPTHKMMADDDISLIDRALSLTPSAAAEKKEAR